jgi:hypothetical protein
MWRIRVYLCASCIVEKVRSLCKIEVLYTIITGSKFCLSLFLSTCSAHQKVGVILFSVFGLLIW